jgi:hypothetical protein
MMRLGFISFEKAFSGEEMKYPHNGGKKLGATSALTQVK